jgi:hypothetical protein
VDPLGQADAMKEPDTLQEWQEAVDAAELLLLIDAARKYGLIRGGPEVNVPRACLIKLKGLSMGIRPSPNLVEKAFRP